MIEVQNLTKSFDDFKALDNLTLTVPKGSIYGLVGPNGAGKSTIIRHITGIFKSDAGEVKINGENIFENVPMKAKIAYIPDDIFFFPSATTLDMMKFYKGIYPNFNTELFEKLREVFTLDPKKPIRRLSKGMQKQYAFWLAICMRPEILVLDEPVDGLDPIMRRQIWSLVMQEVAENGTTVLISSHNLRELEDVCDHVGMLDRGKMLIERSLSDLQDNVIKVNIAFADDIVLPSELDVLHSTSQGKLQTLIIRGKGDEISAILETVNPLFMDILPLTLEEIFVYELGGADYAVKEVIL